MKKLLPELVKHIRSGALHPEDIISHRLPLSQAARAYDIFDRKQDGCRKVVLKPAQAA